jgi:hypothetical protein
MTRLQKIMVGVCALVALTGMTPTQATAGTPWSCVCKGQPKRFIGATHACEHGLYRGTKQYTTRGPTKWYLPRCTTNQFKAWNRQACRQEGCAPTAWAAK